MSKYKWKKHKRLDPGFAKTSTMNRLLEMQVMNSIEAGLNDSLRSFIGEPLNSDIMRAVEAEIQSTLAALNDRGNLTRYTIEQEGTNFLLNIVPAATINSLELQINLQGWNSE